MNIVFCSDNNFLKPTLVSLNSIMSSCNKNNFFNFFVLTPGLSKKNEKILKSFSKNKKCKIELITVDDTILKSCPIKQADHVSLSTYYRILLPSIISKDVKKILYLDGDILCVSELQDFYNTDLSEKSCAVVHDERNNDSEIYQRLEYKKENGYFNAGVMLINLDYWRSHDIQNKTLKYISENKEKCLWHDQDALNYILNGTVEWADFRYNLTQGFMFEKKQLKIDSVYWKKIDSAIKNPCLIHYCAAYKPWHIECNSPFKKLWRKNYKKTFAKNCHLTFKNKGKERIKWCIKLVLNTLRIKNYADFRKSIIKEI